MCFIWKFSKSGLKRRTIKHEFAFLFIILRNDVKLNSIISLSKFICDIFHNIFLKLKKIEINSISSCQFVKLKHIYVYINPFEIQKILVILNAILLNQ